MLLDLPPEVLQNILWHMDPGTLLVCLFVSQRFLDLAHSRRVLLHQLHSLPGITLGLEDLSTSAAFSLFRRRATQNLCGSNVLAQLTKYSPGQGKIKVPSCVFYAGDPAALAVTYRDRAVIRLFDLSERSIRPKADLHAHLFQGEEADGHVELLKVAFSEGRDVAGLYAYTPHIGNGGPMVREAIANSRIILKLVVFKYITSPTDERTEDNTDNHIYSTRQETRDILVYQDTTPLSLAISNDGLACIAWSNVGHDYTTRISLYARNKDLMDSYGYDPSLKEFKVANEQIRTDAFPLVCSMQFTCYGSQLNLYTPGFPIHKHSLNFSIPLGTYLKMNRNLNDMATALLTLDSAIVGTPFYYEHISVSSRTDEREPACLTTLMAVAVAIRSEEHIAFIAECNFEQHRYICEHEPKRVWTSRCTDWKALARLDGFKLDGFYAGHSSLGNVMAVSPQGTRIALSNWAQLRVWALVPDSFREKEQEVYYAVQDLCLEIDVDVLRHVELPSQGVIHSMCWHGEDQLYAMTDRGLVRWDVGAMACGRAELLSSDFEF